jgi:beta-glucosidase
LELKIGKNNLLYSKGCEVNDSSETGFAEAIAIAKQADVVILSVGEARDMSGEAHSRTNIHLPGVQENLIKAIAATGKPIVVLINAGRPLVFNWTADNIPAILYTWWLGSEAGNAIADVLYGDYNPSGKLTMTFPRNEGQIPLYYNHFNTGRPRYNDIDNYVTGYRDSPSTPKFSFGYGLSYTSFEYSDLKLSAKQMKADGTIDISFTLKNTGKVKGEEVVQLYLRDDVASLIRPIKELKGFEKVMLQAGESKEIHFTIDKEKLSFFNNKLDWTVESGTFQIMIGASSEDIKLKSSIELID